MKTFKVIRPHGTEYASVWRGDTVPLSEVRSALQSMLRPLHASADPHSECIIISDDAARELRIHPYNLEAMQELWELQPELVAKWMNSASNHVVVK